MKTLSLNTKAALVSLLIFTLFLGIWHIATLPAPGSGSASTAGMTIDQIEYQKMMGKDVGSTKITGFPTLGQMGVAIWKVHSTDGYLAVHNYEFPLAVLAGCFALATVGAGLVSLDHPLFEGGGSSRSPKYSKLAR